MLVLALCRGGGQGSEVDLKFGSAVHASVPTGKREAPNRAIVLANIGGIEESIDTISTARPKSRLMFVPAFPASKQLLLRAKAEI
jgi:hypothetical protein